VVPLKKPIISSEIQAEIAPRTGLTNEQFERNFCATKVTAPKLTL
jgi:hypothetical protein